MMAALLVGRTCAGDHVTLVPSVGASRIGRAALVYAGSLLDIVLTVELSKYRDRMPGAW